MPIDAVDFNYVRNLVRDQSAIVLDDHKGYLVEARLAPLVRQQGCASIGELLQGLRGRPFNRLHRQVVEAMTTNETSFFRDRMPFEALKSHIIPALMIKRAGTRAICRAPEMITIDPVSRIPHPASCIPYLIQAPRAYKSISRRYGMKPAKIPKPFCTLVCTCTGSAKGLSRTSSCTLYVVI